MTESNKRMKPRRQPTDAFVTGNKPGPKKQRRTGISADAKTLGVSRIHLYYVLTGQRTSASLMKKWNRLQSEKRKNARKLQAQFKTS